MTARIFKPAPSATQSGPGAGKPWRLVFEPESPRSIDPLMGWTSSSDMKQQLRLSFETEADAVAYAERNGIPYRIEKPKPNLASRRGVSYSENFRTGRIGLWTH